MSKTYRHTAFKRFGNDALTRLVRRGRGPRAMHLMTVRGRRTGREYSTPFWVLERPDGRYWVAVFGETETVRNARAAGHITVSKGTSREDVRIVEVPVEDRLPILRDYMGLNRTRTARSFMGASRESPDERLAAIAPDHPVFRLERT